MPRARARSPSARDRASARSVRSAPARTRCSWASAATTSASRVTRAARNSTSERASSARRLAARSQPGLDRGEVPARQEAAHGAQLVHQAVVAAGRVGLALEGAQLAADLADQVLEAHQAGLGRLQPALGFLPAPAVLEDPGRLLDDQAAVLRSGVEHGVELALGDDDVLLAAHAGVGQQLLDVEQAARHRVDGVLAVAGAKQGPGDRHLGEARWAAGRRCCRS